MLTTQKTCFLLSKNLTLGVPLYAFGQAEKVDCSTFSVRFFDCEHFSYPLIFNAKYILRGVRSFGGFSHSKNP